jgi:2-polyprenyl-3-methyl-5-hydroxy-6-metoxy-1,4-benzoquinol methylase
MFKWMADNRDRNSVAAKLRRKRAAFLMNLLAPLKRPIQILDVGGTEQYWKMVDMTEDEIHMTLLNLEATETSLPNCISISGDARQLMFEDKSFDVVFSNSVIEHVGGYADQERMASEVRRVGTRYFVQTPNKYFPIEPHFLFPFFQFLPTRIRVWLLRNFNLGWFPKTADEAKATEIVESIRLLNRTEFVQLFPGAKVYEEKFFGLTKSFIAYDGWQE